MTTYPGVRRRSAAAPAPRCAAMLSSEGVEREAPPELARSGREINTGEAAS